MAIRTCVKNASHSARMLLRRIASATMAIGVCCPLRRRPFREDAGPATLTPLGGGSIGGANGADNGAGFGEVTVGFPPVLGDHIVLKYGSKPVGVVRRCRQPGSERKLLPHGFVFDHDSIVQRQDSAPVPTDGTAVGPALGRPGEIDGAGA